MMSQPGENYEQRVTIEPLRQRVEIFVEGDKVVETRNALRLYEKGLDPVIYVPRDEVRNLHFIKYGDYHCPFKGNAELYHMKHNSHVFEKAAWSYVETYEDISDITNYIAFYPGKVQAIKITG